VKYRKKPIVIEAVQYTRLNIDEVAEFVGFDHLRIGSVGPNGTELHILTLEDGHKCEVKHIATPGDWIIKGISGEFYPCKPDIFEKTYEEFE